MPGFDPTILRDEEKAGGFEPGLAGDDTFSLEQLPAYPGPSAGPGTPAPVADIPIVAEPIAEEQTGAETDTNALIPDQPVAESPVQAESAPATEPANMPYSEPLVLDDSLIALLKEDLTKSKERKRDPEEVVPTAAGRRFDEDFPEPTDNEVTVDLSDIEANHPSTYGIEQEQPAEPVAAAEPVVVEKTTEAPPQEPEKKRRSFPRAAVLALLLLLLLGGAFGAYYFLAPKGTTVAVRDSTTVNNGGTAPATGHTEQPADTAQHGTVLHDTSAGQQALAEDGPRPIPVDTAVIREHTGGVPPATVPAGRTQQEKQQPAPTAAGTAKSPVGTKQSGQQTDGTGGRQTLADNPAGTKSSSGRTESRNRTSSAAARQSGTSTPAAAQQEYVIQVYASPSADDAEEWLGTLKKRNISNGFITSQSVRGQTWYRVRFGSFSTREEAEKRANELGLSNIWVVRTK